jgi:hypothetical protein
MSAVEQAAASTKRRGSQTQLRSDQDIISEPEGLMEQIDQEFEYFSFSPHRLLRVVSYLLTPTHFVSPQS